MSGIIGGDISQLTTLQGQMSSESNNVRELLHRLGGTLDNTYWEGAAATRFREDWENDFKPALQRMADALDDASHEVNARMNALKQASE